MANYLIHYGIKGQAWGIRNGPPYPLNDSSKSSTEKKSSFHLTDKQKKIIKVGAAVIVTGIALYGGYKISQHMNLSKVGELKSTEFSKEIWNWKLGKFVEVPNDNVKTGKSFKELDFPMIARINSDNKDVPKYGGNCVGCSIAYILNSLFPDKFATAKPVTSDISSIDSIFDNIEHLTSGSDYKTLNFNKIPNGTSGILRYCRPDLETAHAINYEKTNNGILTLIDCQSVGLDENGSKWFMRHDDYVLTDIFAMNESTTLKEGVDSLLSEIIKYV